MFYTFYDWLVFSGLGVTGVAFWLMRPLSRYRGDSSAF
jgi:hypothetical protein